MGCRTGLPAYVAWVVVPASRLHRLACRYDNPVPESTQLYPPFRDYEFGYSLQNHSFRRQVGRQSL
jgi:hypothetical protein